MDRNHRQERVTERSLIDILEALRLGKGRPSGAEHDPEGDTGVLRLGDVDYETEQITWTDVMQVAAYAPGEHHFLQDGDVLIVGRGPRRTAVLADDPPPRTVADRTFFVARPDPEQVVPAFLAWYLNEQRAQHYLASHSRGTNIQTIKKSAIERLPVQLPDLDTQRRIERIQSLIQRELELVTQWMDLRAELARGVMLKLVNAS
jgi:hypothetical protein